MTLELFCLCDYAAADAAGRLSIIGMFDSLRLERVPTTHNLCAIAAKIRFDNSEAGGKQIKIVFLDPNRNSIISPMEAALDVAAGQDEPTATAQLAVLISQLKLTSFGQYSLSLEIDNKLLASIPLYVKPADRPART
jgi:hypothetical protein